MGFIFRDIKQDSYPFAVLGNEERSFLCYEFV
jgi:hypothetical protein